MNTLMMEKKELKMQGKLRVKIDLNKNRIPACRL